MRVAYAGNFRPEHSTECHVAASLRDLGHEVIPLQEDDPDTWSLLAMGKSSDIGADVFCWTRTWHLPDSPQHEALSNLRSLGIPSVMYHLDRWWGLNRQHQIFDEPIFGCDLCVTADGGHDAEWKAAGVNHRWLPPAVYRGEAERVGQFQRPFASDVAFVGSWRSYHAEWTHRMELVTHLRRWYGRRFKAWPNGHRSIRGQMLADLYASAKVLVGDSCLVGDPARYHSDRVPETVGRGGFLLHPHVDGVFPELYVPGEHLDTWPLGDWDALHAKIERWLADDEGRAKIASAGREHVLAHHLYEHRMTTVLKWVAEL